MVLEQIVECIRKRVSMPRRAIGLADVRQALTLAGAVLILGCMGENNAPPTQTSQHTATDKVLGCNGSGKPHNDEGEIFGDLYRSGVGACDTLTVILTPIDGTPAHSSFLSTLQTNPNNLNDFEWWDPRTGGACAGYSATTPSTQPEVHPGGNPPTNTEGHCLLPGRYLLTIGPVEGVEIDYLVVQNQGSAQVRISNRSLTPWIDELIQDDIQGAPGHVHVADVIVDVELDPVCGGSGCGTAVLELERVGQDLSAVFGPVFVDQSPVPQGNVNDYVRASVIHSTSTGGRALARIFWSYAADTSLRTGYFPVGVGSPPHEGMIRWHKYTTPGNHLVRLEVRYPDGTVTSTTRTVTIASPPPAESVAVFAGDGQFANVGSAVAIDPAIRLTADGTPVSGRSVTFSILSGSGSITGANTVTDGNGIAAVGSWTLGSVGTNTLQATVAGSGITGNPVVFSATGTNPPTGCTFSPTSFSIPPDQITTQTLAATGSCAGHTAIIRPVNGGSAGFAQGSLCSLTSLSLGPLGLIKVRGCQSGVLELEIKNGSGVVTQTIEFIVASP